MLYWKERVEPGKSKAKDFYFYHGNKDKGRGCDSVIYALDRVNTAATVIVNEGEKQADIVNGWNITNTAGTTLDSGSQSKLTPAMIEALTGKSVYIIRDNDEPGLAYAATIANALSGLCRSVKVILLPGLPHKGDLCDWIKEPGNDKELLLDLIQQAPEWEPTPEDVPAGFNPSELPTGAELQKWEIKVEYLVENFLPKQAITILHGPGGKEPVEK